MIQSEKQIFYKSTFEKISEDKREKIFEVAISEFASNGYSSTNINTIAKKAGISIGSMYSYFASKEDLFLTIVDKGFHLLEKALEEIHPDEGNIFEIIERLFRVTREYAENYPEMNQIYLDLSTQGLSGLSSRLSWQMESITARLYAQILRKAKEQGAISPDIDEQLVSFCLDNLLVMFQFSFTSDYYKDRMKIFLGDDGVRDEERIIEGIMKFVRKALEK
ncbi:TetR/AcrR family transcriptional regulator [Lutispora saccharofermentans]|uniref:TetR/AcrR family transcriptional regulator n=1 Tax=Lutispora saccharofermentans TaxID=3024236 RepID=A0ABT1NE00_9FIRM|nr:TetR/AcrR family transcriptional regulator [Lutispora saccharofermentans]MCQ1529485.1 TetR/AcrR family transcriptional regulator [Lutispora saccharofermentans]